MTTNKSLPLDFLLDSFYIEDSVLKWNRDVMLGSHKKKGGVAGSIGNNGYLRIGLKFEGTKKMYTVHRLMYQIYNNIPILSDDVIIDHVDRNQLNNAINNLRIASKSDNNCNVKLRKDNETGYKNICRNTHKIKTKGSKNDYLVSISKDRKRRSRECKTLEEAIKWRDEMLNKLHSEFASTGEST